MGAIRGTFEETTYKTNSQQQKKKMSQKMKGRESPRKDGLEELAEQVGEAEQRGHSSRRVPFFGGEGQDEYAISIVLSEVFLGLDLPLELPGTSSICLGQPMPKERVERKRQVLMPSFESCLKPHLRLLAGLFSYTIPPPPHVSLSE